MKRLGLLGKSLSHSKSPELFSQFFAAENTHEWKYELFEKASLYLIKEWALKEQLEGFNVTFPYKTEILSHCDMMSEEVAAIGAANTIKICRDFSSPQLMAHNTDIFGFNLLLEKYLPQFHSVPKALILGTGGASKAVAYVLHQKKIPFVFVSRNAHQRAQTVQYEDISAGVISTHLLIIQTTLLGMYPHTDEMPIIPYEYLGNTHVCIDLIYQPEVTQFMRSCRENGATVENGWKMLQEQAKKAWQIFNSPC